MENSVRKTSQPRPRSLGIGYYYLSVKNPTLQIPILGTKSFLRGDWGFEAFYNVALRPWLLLTPDV